MVRSTDWWIDGIVVIIGSLYLMEPGISESGRFIDINRDIFFLLLLCFQKQIWQFGQLWHLFGTISRFLKLENDHACPFRWQLCHCAGKHPFKTHYKRKAIIIQQLFPNVSSTRQETLLAFFPELYLLYKWVKWVCLPLWQSHHSVYHSALWEISTQGT